MATSQRSDLHGVLVVDKTPGPTSHDVVAVARRALGTREIGHTGTLDPMATGVLVLVVGEATKLVNMLGALSKAYLASVRLGVATSTLDAEGEVVESRPVPALSLADVQLAAERFHGEIEQRAPLVSAIKIGGKSLHKRARAGEVIEPPVRRVRVDVLQVLAVQGECIELSVECGKGFYVRALARDLAEALGSVGHLSALRRTRNGQFVAEGAVDFTALRQAAHGTELDKQRLRERVLPLGQICQALPYAVLDPVGCEHIRHGRPVPLSSVCAVGPLSSMASDAAASGPHLPADGEQLIALDASCTPLAIVRRSADVLRVVRGFCGN